MPRKHMFVAATLLVATTMSVTSGQATGAAQPGAAKGTSAPPSAPAVAAPTKLEGFKPAAGSVTTFGYDELGDVGSVSVDVREVRDSRGNAVRGLTVEVQQGQYSKERSFVDADEIPELIKGIDALLGVKANPTSFKNFEIHYDTRGELRIIAFSSSDGTIQYSVEAGRITKARSFLDGDDLRKLRAMFETARLKLAGPRP